jgi:acetylornithine deacetylase
MLAADLIAHLNEIASGLAEAAHGAGSQARFVPPHTTVSVNTIQGGTATNILAGACEFTWDIRALPGESPDRILAALAELAGLRRQAILAEGKRCAINTTILANVPPLEADNGLAEQLARAISPAASGTITVPFATEGGQFQRAGWSTVVCGPGSIEQAHKPDEFIERAELQACESFLDRAIARQCRN